MRLLHSDEAVEYDLYNIQFDYAKYFFEKRNKNKYIFDSALFFITFGYVSWDRIKKIKKKLNKIWKAFFIKINLDILWIANYIF